MVRGTEEIRRKLLPGQAITYADRYVVNPKVASGNDDGGVGSGRGARMGIVESAVGRDHSRQINR